MLERSMFITTWLIIICYIVCVRDTPLRSESDVYTVTSVCYFLLACCCRRYICFVSLFFNCAIEASLSFILLFCFIVFNDVLTKFSVSPAVCI